MERSRAVLGMNHDFTMEVFPVAKARRPVAEIGSPSRQQSLTFCPERGEIKLKKSKKIK